MTDISRISGPRSGGDEANLINWRTSPAPTAKSDAVYVWPERIPPSDAVPSGASTRQRHYRHRRDVVWHPHPSYRLVEQVIKADNARNGAIKSRPTDRCVVFSFTFCPLRKGRLAVGSTRPGAGRRRRLDRNRANGGARDRRDVGRRRERDVLIAPRHGLAPAQGLLLPRPRSASCRRVQGCAQPVSRSGKWLVVFVLRVFSFEAPLFVVAQTSLSVRNCLRHLFFTFFFPAR